MEILVVPVNPPYTFVDISCILSHIFMPSDLQSVENYLCVRMSLCPENVGNWSFSPQNESGLSPTSIPSYFPLLQGLSFMKSPKTLFRSNWVNYGYNLQSNRLFFSIQLVKYRYNP